MTALLRYGIMVLALAGVAAAGPILYSNGPLVTHPGGGAGGADASALQSALGMNTYGFGHQASVGYRIADDFTVPAGGWQIGAIVVYAYQTGSPTSPSPFTAVNMQIWDGPPGQAGSSVVWGDTTTNLLLSSTWSGIYRVLDTSLLGTTRPVFANTLDVNVYLPAGTYWLDWQSDGSLAYTGPWAPPVTILGQTTTGNAMHYTGSWLPVVDTGTGTGQDFPFLIEGVAGVVIPEPGTVTLLGAGLLALAIAARRRRLSG